MFEHLSLEEYRALSQKKSIKKPVRNKYQAIKQEVDGLTFDSKREAGRYRELKLLASQGLITNFERQVRFPLLVNEQKVGTYVADFVYEKNGERVVEDVKSDMTRKLPVYRLKCKLMNAIYGISILET
jgi:hypothetical protein